MKLEDLLKGTPHEGEPTTKPPRVESEKRMDMLENAIIELAALVGGDNDG